MCLLFSILIRHFGIMIGSNSSWSLVVISLFVFLFVLQRMINGQSESNLQSQILLTIATNPAFTKRFLGVNSKQPECH